MKNNILDVNKLVLALAEYPEAEGRYRRHVCQGRRFIWNDLSEVFTQLLQTLFNSISGNLFRKRADESQIPGSRQADPWNYFPYPEGDRISYYHPICGYR